jgi:hypothetical protein
MNKLILFLGKYKVLLAFIALTLAIAYAIHDINQQAADQLKNRVSNVYNWCDGINADRNYNRTYVNSLIKLVDQDGLHIPLYTLKDKDCTALALKTAISGGDPSIAAEVKPKN